MNASSIAFVGGGNMAGSLVGGLLARGWRATSIRVSDPEEASLARLAFTKLYCCPLTPDIYLT